MNRQPVFKMLVLAATLVPLAWSMSRLPAQENPRNAEAQDVEVLARGPVHEAFAEPIVFNPSPGIVVQREPPAPINEVPPEQKPVGRNVSWIPGYWGWDEEREDFLWISGFWRNLPPGREWIPGYWQESADGWRWVSGYWADARAERLEYLPPPPESLEYGPSSPAPGANYVWAPGCWFWVESRYLWRPGYWVPARQDWIWVPDYFVWTPRGCVFVDGYWDYSLHRRGILFAPVYYPAPLYARAGYSYSPSIVVDIGVLTAHFFVWPQHRHYYFGDYYASDFGDRGVYPWFAFASSRRGYDPIFAHSHTQFSHTDRNWETRLRHEFAHRQENETARPPRTAAEVMARADRSPNRDEAHKPLVQPLAKLAAVTGAVAGTQLHLERIDRGRRDEMIQHAKETRAFIQERKQLESSPGTEALPASPRPTDRPGKDARPKTPDTAAKEPVAPKEPVKVERPKSPIASPAVPPVQTAPAPASSPDAPKAAPKSEPKPPKGVVPDVKKPRQDVPKAPTTEPKTPPDASPKPMPTPKREPTRPRDDKPRSLPTPKVDPQPPAVTPPTPKPKTEPKAPATPPVAPSPTPKVEPKAPPKVEPKAPQAPPASPPPSVEPKPPAAPAVPKSPPRVEPQPSPPKAPSPPPRVEPQPSPPKAPSPPPRVEPQPKPTPPAPQAPPKVEPKPAPPASPSPPPRVEPKPPKEPRGGGGGRPEGGKEKGKEGGKEKGKGK